MAHTRIQGMYKLENVTLRQKFVGKITRKNLSLRHILSHKGSILTAQILF